MKFNIQEIEHLRKKCPRHGYYFNVFMTLSPAYQSLTIASRNLLYLMVLGTKYHWVKNKGKKEKHYPRNSKIGLPESEFRKYYKCCSQTYYNARNQLIEVGFIRQTKQGGYGKGDYATYKLLFLSDVENREQRWQYYPEKNWKKDIPKRSDCSIGKATQFKKGESGRKTKATLLQ